MREVRTGADDLKGDFNPVSLSLHHPAKKFP